MPMVSAGLYFQVSSTPTKMLGTPITVVGRDAVAQWRNKPVLSNSDNCKPQGADALQLSRSPMLSC